jgi:ElaB/YqjD/DUF883 family membrane-anchored ribosome-binding protein
MNPATMNKLMEDLRIVVTDAEALLEATAHDATDRAKSARERAMASIETARANLADLQAELGARTKAAAREADLYVHENPWKSIGVVGAVGLLVGLLIGRR